MESLMAGSLEQMQIVAASMVVLYAWALFFRIRYLEKDFSEEKKSWVAQSCAVPLLITLGFLSCFGMPLPHEISTGMIMMWLVFLVLSVVGFILMLIAHMKAEKAYQRTSSS